MTLVIDYCVLVMYLKFCSSDTGVENNRRGRTEVRGTTAVCSSWMYVWYGQRQIIFREMVQGRPRVLQIRPRGPTGGSSFSPAGHHIGCWYYYCCYYDCILKTIITRYIVSVLYMSIYIFVIFLFKTFKKKVFNFFQ